MGNERSFAVQSNRNEEGTRSVSTNILHFAFSIFNSQKAELFARESAAEGGVGDWGEVVTR